MGTGHLLRVDRAGVQVVLQPNHAGGQVRSAVRAVHLRGAEQREGDGRRRQPSGVL